MFSSAVLLFVASALFSTSHATNFVVQVGVEPPTGQSGHRYSPTNVTGAVAGDTITFQFLPSGHTATQGTLATPCSPLSGGFDSGQYVIFPLLLPFLPPGRFELCRFHRD
jgi:hypothetical protein